MQEYSAQFWPSTKTCKNFNFCSSPPTAPMLSSARRQAWFNPEPERVPTEDLGARRFLRDARAMELSATDPAEPVATSNPLQKSFTSLMLLILWCGCYATFCLSFCYSPCGGSVLLPDWVSGECEGSGWRTTLWGHRLTPRVLVQRLPVIGRGRAPPQSVQFFRLIFSTRPQMLRTFEPASSLCPVTRVTRF